VCVCVVRMRVFHYVSLRFAAVFRFPGGVTNTMYLNRLVQFSAFLSIRRSLVDSHNSESDNILTTRVCMLLRV